MPLECQEEGLHLEIFRVVETCKNWFCGYSSVEREISIQHSLTARGKIAKRFVRVHSKKRLFRYRHTPFRSLGRFSHGFIQSAKIIFSRCFAQK